MIRSALSAVAAVSAFAVAAPAWSQESIGHEGHEGHHGHSMPAAATSDDKAHEGHVSPVPAPVDSPAADPHAGMDHGAMDHGTMDHGAIGHGAASAANGDASPGPSRETLPPPEAGSGPPRAADAIWGAEVMRAARLAEHRAHGDFPVLWVQADRLEGQVRDGADGFLWDVQGYYGGPTNRFWFKSEGEGAFGEGVEDAELQALWSRAISPYWDVQLGVRQDVAGPDTTHAVIGVQGLAPYMFEVDAALFLSHRGDVTGRVEAELDQRVTQRLILQPRVELNFSAQDIPEIGVGAGLDKIEAGIRLRYEFEREFAPYIGVEQTWLIGGSADYARLGGKDTRATSFVAGVRVWF